MCKLKKIAVAVIALFTAASATAQLVNRTDLSFVRDALTPSLRVVRTSYDIARKDFSEYFSADNDTVFGRSYTLGVVVPGGMVVSSHALAPWDADPKYEYYRNDETLTTKINDCVMSSLLPDADYRVVEIDEFSTPVPIPEVLNDSPVYFIDVTNNIGADALEIMTPDETTNGLAIWVATQEGRSLDSTTDMFVKIENAKLEFDAVNPWATIKKVATKGEILGGIFVVPILKAPGVLQFTVAGFMAPPTGPNEPWRVIKAQLPAPDDEVEIRVVHDAAGVEAAYGDDL